MDQLIRADRRRHIGSGSTSGWKPGAEQTIGNLEVFGYTRTRSTFVEYKTDVAFTARATALEEYASYASQKGWPECELGTPCWREGKVFIECLIIIPHGLVGESREICEKLNDLTEPSAPGRRMGSPGAEAERD